MNFYLLAALAIATINGVSCDEVTDVINNEVSMISLLCILFSASAIYFLENEAQPEVFSSITASLWWATVSLATVGYGDVVPMTVWGKVFAGFISLIGIGVVAIPTGIISASFVEEIHHFRKKR